MRICLSVSSFHAQITNNILSLESFLTTAKHLNFNAVEVCDKSLISSDTDYLYKLKQTLFKLELNIAALDVRNDFTYKDQSKLSNEINHVNKWIKAAAILNIPIIRIWAGRASNNSKALKQVSDVIKDIIPFSKQHGVKLALENHDEMTSDYENILKIFHNVDSEWFGVCPDFEYFPKDDLYDALSEVIPYSIHMHSKSHEFNQHEEEKNFSYKRIGEIIKKNKYNNYISIEFEGDGEDRTQGIIATKNLIDKYFINDNINLNANTSISRSEEPINLSEDKKRKIFDASQRLLKKNSDDFWRDSRNAIEPFINELANKPEVEGIVLLGSISRSNSRKYYDHYSDVDLTVFLNIPESSGYFNSKDFSEKNQDILPSWLPEFQFYIPVKELFVEINCHQLIYQIENSQMVYWDESKREAYKHTSEIVYDRNGYIKKLIDLKTNYNLEDNKNHIIILAGQLPWYGWINPERQFIRGYPSGSHLLLNKAIEIILELILAINKREKPHTKWLLEYVKGLNWLPTDFNKKIVLAMQIFNIEKKDIMRRIRIIKEIADDVINYAKKMELIPENPFYYTSLFLDTERQLMHNTSADMIFAQLKKKTSESEKVKFKGMVNYLLLSKVSSINEINIPSELKRRFKLDKELI